MALQDFAKKNIEVAREHGVGRAFKDGASEAVLKACGPLSRELATPIWQAEWDICLVLDACRVDLWKEVVNESGPPCVSGKTGVAWSLGSASPEWIGQTFADRHHQHWKDAGYVTANPFSGKHPDEMGVLGNDVYPLRERGLAYLDEVWVDQWPMSETMQTVDPSVLTARAMWAWEHREMNQLVVHYMQPHIPFKSNPEWCDGWDGTDAFGDPQKADEDSKDDWFKVRDGEIPEDEFWNAYAANLEWALTEVQRWADRVDARILVTSDHGNAMGEFGQWSHPPRSANPVLRRVPWVLVDGRDGGWTTPDPPGNPPVVSGQVDGPQTETAQEKLEALGYL